MSTTDQKGTTQRSAPATAAVAQAKPSPWTAWFSGTFRSGFTSLVAIAAALVVGAIVILMTGDNPLAAYRALLSGALGSERAVAQTLVSATPLALGGLAFAVASRAGLFNIGVEGQLFLGSLAAGLVAATDFGLPTIVHLPLVLLVGAVVGGIWAGLPGIFLAKRGASVVITTIMLNYISYRISSWAVTQDDWLPVERERSGTERALDTAVFGRMLEGTRLHYGVLLVPVAALALWLLLFRTTFGYRLRTVGLSRGAADYGGISWGKTIVLAMFTSGVFAGLAGAIELTGVTARHTNPAPGYGFTAIAVALAGRNHPFGVLVASLLFGVMAAGSTRMQSEAGTSSQLVQILQALVILAVAAAPVLGRLWGRRRGTRPPRLAPSSNSGLGTSDPVEPVEASAP